MKRSTNVIKFPQKKRPGLEPKAEPMTQERFEIGRKAIAKMRKMLEEDQS